MRENLKERREDTMKAILIQCGAVLVIFVAGVWVGKTTTADAAAKGRVFEIRTYTANEGKLEALHVEGDRAVYRVRAGMVVAQGGGSGRK